MSSQGWRTSGDFGVACELATQQCVVWEETVDISSGPSLLSPEAAAQITGWIRPGRLSMPSGDARVRGFKKAMVWGVMKHQPGFGTHATLQPYKVTKVGKVSQHSDIDRGHHCAFCPTIRGSLPAALGG
jgi:hypothetical protein